MAHYRALGTLTLRDKVLMRHMVSMKPRFVAVMRRTAKRLSDSAGSALTAVWNHRKRARNLGRVGKRQIRRAWEMSVVWSRLLRDRAHHFVEKALRRARQTMRVIWKFAMRPSDQGPDIPNGWVPPEFPVWIVSRIKSVCRVALANRGFSRCDRNHWRHCKCARREVRLDCGYPRDCTVSIHSDLAHGRGRERLNLAQATVESPTRELAAFACAHNLRCVFGEASSSSRINR